MRETGSTRGRLLVATPPLSDPNFDRSVVFMLEHRAQGAIGVVINRPTHTPVATILADWSDRCATPATIFRGGPVGTDSLIALAPGGPDRDHDAQRAEHGDGEQGDGEQGDGEHGDDGPDEVGGIATSGGMVITVDLAAPDADVERVRVFAGYAGWGPGQLDDELDASAWLVLDADLDDLFSATPERLWREVLARQRGQLAWLANAPDDLSAN